MPDANEPKYPLFWPHRLRRTPANKRAASKFKVSPMAAWTELLDEINRFGGIGPIVSSNAMRRKDGKPYTEALTDQLDDPGVAVYFTRKTTRACMPCDQFLTVRENIRAISNSIAALREIDRNGSSLILDAAFAGFIALPPPPGWVPWWEVLGVRADATKEAISAARKALAREHSTDEAKMQAINVAHDEGMKANA